MKKTRPASAGRYNFYIVKRGEISIKGLLPRPTPSAGSVAQIVTLLGNSCIIA